MTISLQDANDILRARLARMLALTSVIERDLSAPIAVNVSASHFLDQVAAKHHDVLSSAHEDVIHAVHQWRKAGGQA